MSAGRPDWIGLDGLDWISLTSLTTRSPYGDNKGVCASVLICIDNHPLPHINLIMNIPQEENMELQEVFVVITLSVFNVCWGVIASLPVKTLLLKK